MDKSLPRLLLASFRPRHSHRALFSLPGVLGGRKASTLRDPVRSPAFVNHAISVSHFRRQYSNFSSISHGRSLLPLYILAAAFWATYAIPILVLISATVNRDEDVNNDEDLLEESADPEDWRVYGQIVSYDINGELRWRRLADHVNFRLLTVEPDDGDGDLMICSLKEYPLEHCPPYEAISYSWRTTGGQADIVCDGVKITVSRSLYDALQAVRKAGGRRTVWADAVCIGQDDIEERSRQVQTIGRIFSQAVLVWAHVGETCNNTAGAIDLIERFVATELGRRRSRESGASAEPLGAVLLSEALDYSRDLLRKTGCPCPWGRLDVLGGCRETGAKATPPPGHSAYSPSAGSGQYSTSGVLGRHTPKLLWQRRW